MIGREIVKEVSRDGILKLLIPEYSGQKVKVIYFPVSKNKDESSKYFECVGEDGTEYKLHDWTDEDFNRFSRTSACKDDDTVAEDILDV